MIPSRRHRGYREHFLSRLFRGGRGSNTFSTQQLVIVMIAVGFGVLLLTWLLMRAKSGV